MTTRKSQRKRDSGGRQETRSRKTTWKRPIAMLLVFVMFLGVAPVDLIPRVWAADEVDSGQPGSLPAADGVLQMDGPIDIEADWPADVQSKLTELNGYLSDLPSLEDVPEANVKNLTSAEVSITQSGVYHVYQSSTAVTANRITISNNADVVMFLDRISISVASNRSGISVAAGSSLTLILVEGTTSRIANTASSTNYEPLILAPDGARLIVTQEKGREGTATLNLDNSKVPDSPAIGGAKGNAGPNNIRAGGTGGDIAIVGATVTSPGKIGGGRGSDGVIAYGNGTTYYAGTAGGAGGVITVVDSNLTVGGLGGGLGGGGANSKGGAAGGAGGNIKIVNSTVQSPTGTLAFDFSIGGNKGGNGGTGIPGSNSTSSSSKTGGNGGTGGTGGNGGAGGTITIIGSTVAFKGGSAQVGYIGGGMGGKGGNGGAGGKGFTGTSGNSGNGGTGGSGGKGGNLGAGGTITIMDSTVNVTHMGSYGRTGGEGGNGGTGGASGGAGGSAGAAGGKGAIGTGANSGTLKVGDGERLESSHISAVKSNVSGDYLATKTILSGSVQLSNNNVVETAQARPTNGTAYGNKPLYSRTITVKDYKGSNVPGAWIEIEVALPDEEPYTYSAYASNGVAYVWLPLGEYSGRAWHETRGEGEEPIDLKADNETGTIIYIAATGMNLSKSATGKSYTPINLNVELVNSNFGDEKSFEGVSWFRTPISDDTVYTADNFTDGFDAAGDGDKGSSLDENSSLELLYRSEDEERYQMEAAENGRYWFKGDMVDGKGEFVEMVKSIEVDNIYTVYPVGVRWKVEKTGEYLYGSETYYPTVTKADGSVYGVPFDLHGEENKSVISDPYNGFDEIEFTVRNQYKDHWIATLGGVDVYTLGPIALDNDFINNDYCDGGDPTKYTLLFDNTQQPVASRWREIDVELVDQYGEPIQFGGQVPLEKLKLNVPMDEDSRACYSFYLRGGRYTPYTDGRYVAYGYYVARADGQFYPEVMPCSKFAEFDPTIYEDTEKIYIVYEEGYNYVNEYHLTEDGVPFGSSLKALSMDQSYEGEFNEIPGYVEVGYKIVRPGTEGEGDEVIRQYWIAEDGDALEALGPTGSQKGYIGAVKFTADVFEPPGQPLNVYYYYDQEMEGGGEGGTGIPKKQGARISVLWNGSKVNDRSTYTLDSKLVTVRINTNVTIFNDHDNEEGRSDHSFPDKDNPEGPGKWVFDYLAAEPEKTIAPVDGDSTVIFPYAYDTLGEGTPDKYQYVEETYRLDGVDGEAGLLYTITEYLLVDKKYRKEPPFFHVGSNDEVENVLYQIVIDGAAQPEGTRIAEIEPVRDNVHKVEFVYRAPAYLDIEVVASTYMTPEDEMPLWKESVLGYHQQSALGELDRAIETNAERYPNWLLEEILLDGAEIDFLISEEEGHEGEIVYDLDELILDENERHHLKLSYTEAGKITRISVRGVEVKADEDGEIEKRLLYQQAAFDMRKLEEFYDVWPVAQTGMTLVNAEINGIDVAGDRWMAPLNNWDAMEALRVYPADSHEGGDSVNDAIEVEFIYMDNYIDVIVYLREWYEGAEEEDEEIPLEERLGPSDMTLQIGPRELGTSFEYSSPIWPDHQILDLSFDEEEPEKRRPTSLVGKIEELTADEHTLTFWYEPAEGDLVLIGYDDDADAGSLGLEDELYRTYLSVPYNEEGFAELRVNISNDQKYYDINSAFLQDYSEFLETDLVTGQLQLVVSKEDIWSFMDSHVVRDEKGGEQSVLYIPYSREKATVLLRAVNINGGQTVTKKVNTPPNPGDEPAGYEDEDLLKPYWLEKVYYELEDEKRVGEIYDYGLDIENHLNEKKPDRFHYLSTGQTFHLVQPQWSSEIDGEDEDGGEGETEPGEGQNEEVDELERRFASDPNVIPVFYQPDPDNAIFLVVIDYETGEELEEYTTVFPAGDGFKLILEEDALTEAEKELYYPKIAGYELRLDDPRTRLTAVAGDDNGSRIVFVMEDMRWIIKIRQYVEDEEEGWKLYGDEADEAGREYERLVPYVGSERYNMIVPSIFGYTPSKYTAGAMNGTISEDKVVFSLSSSMINASTRSLTVDIYYITIDNAADEYYVTLTVMGLGNKNGGQESLYQYPLRVKKNSQVTLTQSEHGFDMMPHWRYATGSSNDNIIVNVKNTNLQEWFLYEYNLETVTISAVDCESGDNILTDIEIGGVRVDQPFSYEAPVIPGYLLTDSQGNFLSDRFQQLDRTGAYTPKLTFYYIKADGNITVLHKDVNGDLLDITYADIPEVGGTAVVYPLGPDHSSMKHYTLADGQPADISLKWETDGDEENVNMPPFTREFLYEKKTATVTLEAWDTVTGQAVKDGGQVVKLKIEDRRVEEPFDYKVDWEEPQDHDPEDGPALNWLQQLTEKVKAVNGGYYAAAQGSTLMQVEANGANTMKVWFTPPADGYVPVLVYEVTGWSGEPYDSEPLYSEPPLRSYSQAAMPKETVTLSSDPAAKQLPAIPGYRFVEQGSKLSATEGDPKPGGAAGERDAIHILMEDIRPEVTLRLHKLDQPDGTEPEKVTGRAELEQNGTTYRYTVYIPYLDGYALSTYQVSKDGEEDDEDFGDHISQFTITGIEREAAVDLYYNTLDLAADDRYVNLEITGVSGSRELYRYTIRHKKADQDTPPAERDVKVAPLRVSGFEPEGGYGEIPLPLDGNTSGWEFTYKDLSTYVTVKMVDEGGSEISPSFRVEAQEGSAFTYNAPHVMGYALVSGSVNGTAADSAIGSVIPVEEDGKSVLTFTYRKITSLVSLVAKEEGTNWVIRVVELDESDLNYIESDSKWEVDAPSLLEDFYRPTKEKISFEWDGQQSIQVEAEYEKLTTRIQIDAKEKGTEEILLTPSPRIDRVRLGEAVTVAAPDVEGYTAADDRTQTVIPVDIPADDTEATLVTFYYEKVPAGQLAVKAVDETGNVLQSYHVKGDAGSKITVKAPTIPGYALAADEEKKSLRQVKITGEAGQEEVFRYVDRRVAIQVILRDGAKDPGDSGAILSSPGFADWILVPKGTDYTVEAPHVAGYVIDGKVRETLINVTQEVTEVTFTYKSVLEAADGEVAVITIEGVAKEPGNGLSADEPLYSYEKQVKKSLQEYEVVEAQEVWDYLPTWIPAHTEEELLALRTFAPNEDEKKVTFYYHYNLGTLKIKLVDQNGAALPGGEIAISSIRQDQPYPYSAPVVPGYQLIDAGGKPVERTVETITPERWNGQNHEITLTYRYAKAEGNVHVTHVDADDNSVILKESYAQIDPEDVEKTFYSQSISNYTVTGDTEKTVTWDEIKASAQVPYSVVFQYSRNTTAIKLEAYDAVSGKPIKDETTGEVVSVDVTGQKVESYIDYEDFIAGLTDELTDADTEYDYKLSSQGTTLLWVSALPATGENSAAVWYMPLDRMSVVVEVWIDEVGSGLPLDVYTIPAGSEETVKLEENAQDLNRRFKDYTSKGYDIDKSKTDGWQTKEGSGQSIIVIVKDIRHTVTVKAEVGESAKQAAYKVFHGDTQLVDVFYFAGQALDRYTEDRGEGPQEVEGADKSQIEVANVTGDVEIVLQYKTIQEMVDAEQFDVKITGMPAGYDDSTKPLYSYTTRVSLDEEKEEKIWVVTPGEIFGLTPAWTLKEGEEEKGKIKPDGKQKEIVFEYENNLAEVIVYAYEYGTDPEDPQTAPVISPIYLTNVELDQELAYESPLIPGYTLVDKEGKYLIRTTAVWDDAVPSGSNPHKYEIHFFYKKSEGDILVRFWDVLVEEDESEGIAEVLKEIGTAWMPLTLFEYNVVEPVEIPYYVRPKDSLWKTVYFDGETELNPIDYKYRRETNSLELVAINRMENAPIKGNTQNLKAETGQERILEEYNFSEHLGTLTDFVQNTYPGYRLITKKATAVIPDKGDDNKVEIFYDPPKDGMMPVEIRVNDFEEGQSARTGTLLQEYFIPAAENELISLTGKDQAPDLKSLGYNVDPALTGSKTTARMVTGDENTYLLLMAEDERLTITAKATVEKEEGETERLEEEFKVVSGDGAVVPTFYVPGYVATGYQITWFDEEGNPLPEEPQAKNLYNVPFENVTENAEIEFFYQDMESIVDDLYSIVTIRGLKDVDGLNVENPDEEHILFSQIKRLPKNQTGETTVVVDPDADLYSFAPAWKLKEGYGPQHFEKELKDNSYTLNFLYDDQERQIQIILKDEDGNLIDAQGKPAEDHQNQPVVTGYVNQELMISAPVVPGYQLSEEEKYAKEWKVKGDSANEITFEYVKMEGLVYVQLIYEEKAQQEGGWDTRTIITQYTLPYEEGAAWGDVTGEQSQWLEDAPEGWKFAKDPVKPEEDDTHNEFPLKQGRPAFLTYLVVPDMQDITVLHVKQGTAEEVGSQAKIFAQVNKTKTVVANPTTLKAGYVLVGDPFQDFLVKPAGKGDNIVRFQYEDLGEQGAGRVSVVGVDKEGNGIYYSELKATDLNLGDPFEAAMPSVSGYGTGEHDPDSAGIWDEEDGVVKGTIKNYSQIVRFVYEEADWVKIPIHAVDAAGQPLEGVEYKAWEGSNTVYRVDSRPKDSAYTVHIPAVPGYEPGPDKDGQITLVIEIPKVGAANQPQVVFHYQPISANYTTIALKGMDGSKEIFQQTTLLANKEGGDIIKAPQLPGYVLDEREDDNYLDPLDPKAEELGLKQAELAGGREPFTFHYVKEMAQIAIITVDQDGTPIGASVDGYHLQAEGRVGDTITIFSPVVEDYELMKKVNGADQRSSVSVLVSANPQENTYTFQYEQVSGNVLVQLVQPANEEEKRKETIIHQESFTFAVNDTSDQVIAALAGKLPAAPVGWTYSLAEPAAVPKEGFVVSSDQVSIVKYWLEPDLKDIAVHYTVKGSDPEKAAAPSGTVKGQIGCYTLIEAEPDPLTLGMVIDGTPYKSYYVDPEKDQLSHTFYYEDRSEYGVGQIIVTAMSKVEEGEKPQWLYYQNQTTSGMKPGDTVPVNAPDVPGWKLAAGEPETYTVTVDEEGQIITFLFVKEEVEVTLNLLDYEGKKIEKEFLPADIRYLDELDDTNAAYASYQAQTRLSHTVYAPRIKDYQLVEIQSERGTIGSNTVHFEEMKQAETITFVFRHVDELVMEKYADVKVEGYLSAKDGEGQPLDGPRIFTETRLLEKGDQTITFPELYGYELDSDRGDNYKDPHDRSSGFGEKELEVTGPDTVKFYYVKNEAEITIKTLDSAGNPVGSSLVQHLTTTGRIGDKVMIHAPVVTGYELAEEVEKDVPQKSTIDYEVTGSNDTVTFIYEKIRGNVLVQLVDEKDPETVLYQKSYTLDTGWEYEKVMERLTDRPFASPDGWEYSEVVTTIPADGFTVKNDELAVVRFHMKKDMKEITVYYLKEGADLNSLTEADYVAQPTKTRGQAGHDILLFAEPETVDPGWILIGSPVAEYRVKTDAQTGGEPRVYAFYYKDRSGTGAGKVIVTAVSQDETTALYYEDLTPDNAVAGKTKVTVRAPEIDGWELKLGAGQQKEMELTVTEDAQVITFHYGKEDATVSVYLVNTEKGRLPDDKLPGQYEDGIGGTGTLFMEYKTQKNLPHTVSIGHMDQFQLQKKLTTVAPDIGEKRSDGSVHFSKLTDDVAVTFVFKDIGDIVAEGQALLTVEGRLEGSGTQDAPLYSTSRIITKEENGDTEVLLTYGQEIMPIPAHALVKTESDPAWGVDADGSQTYTVAIKPDEKQVTVSFEYKANVTDVTVYTREYGTESQIMQPMVIPNVEIGSTFVFDAPSIPGWQLVYSSKELAGQNRYDYTGSIFGVSEEYNTLTFHYKYEASESTLMVQQIDEETGKSIGFYYEEIEKGVSKEITAKELLHYEVSDSSKQPITVEWDGEGQPEPVSFYYVKNRLPVKLVALNASDMTEIEDENGDVVSIEIMARVQEVLDYNEDVDGIAQLLRKVQAVQSAYGPDRLPETTRIYVDPDNPDKNIAKIYFSLPRDGYTPAEMWLYVDGDPDSSDLKLKYLYTYEVEADRGRPVTLDESELHDLSGLGYEFTDLSRKLSVLEAPTAEHDRFFIVMDDARVTVSVTTVTDVTRKDVEVQKVVKRSDLRISVPSEPGFLFEHYEIHNASIGSSKPLGDPDTKTVNVTNVTEDTEVVFYYKPEGGRPEDFIDIHVSGMTPSGAMSYQEETIAVEKNSGFIEVPSRDLSGEGYFLSYAMADGQILTPDSRGAITVNVEDKDIQIYFIYLSEDSYDAVVEIHMVDEKGEHLQGSPKRDVPAVAGQPFTFNAPHVDDHYLLGVKEPVTDPETGEITGERLIPGKTIGFIEKVDVEGRSVITFVYREIPEPSGEEGENIIIWAAEALDGDYRIIKGIKPEAGYLKDGNYYIPLDEINLSLKEDYFSFDGVKDVQALGDMLLTEPELPQEEEDISDENTDLKEPDGEEGTGPDEGDSDGSNNSGGDEDDRDETDNDSEEGGGSSGQAGDTDGQNGSAEGTGDGSDGDKNVTDSGDSGGQSAGDNESTGVSTDLAGSPGSLLVGSYQNLSRSGRGPLNTRLTPGRAAAQAAVKTDGKASSLIGYDKESNSIVIAGYEKGSLYEITVFYTKDIAQFTLAAREKDKSGALIDRLPAEGRMGEAVLVAAPAISGYTLIGQESQMTIAKNSDDPAFIEPEFYYRSQTFADHGDLAVYVTGNGSYLPNVTVTAQRIDGRSDEVKQGVTGKDGSLIMEDLDFGNYLVTAKASGYADTSQPVEMTAAKQILNFTLSKSTYPKPDPNPGPGTGGKEDPKLDEKQEEEELIPGDLEELLKLMRDGEHIAYLTGYQDETVRPDASITRAEAATIFYQLMKPYLNEEFAINGVKATAKGVSYSDVSPGQWYTTAVSTLSSHGILTGYPDGTFRPEDSITRAEFTVILSQLAGMSGGSHKFSDASGHWADTYIANVYGKGWITGYPDGTFRPDASITRGETVSMVNRMLERNVHKDDIPVSAKKYRDLQSSHWAYEDIVEASNNHDYERLADGYEKWH